MNADELKSVLDLHAKWLRGEEGGSRANLYGADLSDADLRRANLRRANLSDADLRRADLRDANLVGANLSGADLSYANLIGADLRGADLSRANLSRANLSGASLRGANLSRADLRRADLRGADLGGANGIISFGPIGENKRIGYAWLDKGKTMFRLGCHNGNLKETVTAIREKYGLKSTYEAMVKLVAKIQEEEA
jgi:hypothetical protein